MWVPTLKACRSCGDGWPERPKEEACNLSGVTPGPRYSSRAKEAKQKYARSVLGNIEGTVRGTNEEVSTSDGSSFCSEQEL